MPMNRPVNKSRFQTQLQVEQLEDRCLPSAVGANPRELSVMSRNLYVGADVAPIVGAVLSGDSTTILTTVTQTWQNVLATNFPARADLLAAEIDAAQPDLIGLQEVSLWRTGAPDRFFGNATRAEQVELDYLQILIDELDSRGLHYGVVAVTNNFDDEFTGSISGVLNPADFRDIRLTDRDVILARTDLPTSQMKLSNVQAHNFVVNVQIPLGGGQVFNVLRGWNSVDVQTRGKDVRFINAHLEADVPIVQVLQAQELIAGPANTSMNVVMAGDFNSPADGSGTPTYSLLIASGFTDAWTQTQPGDAGYTYGNTADLLNPVALSFQPQRIDLVLFKGDVTAQSMDRVGDDVRTASGLWPSDHAGVVATLGIHVRPLAKSQSAAERPGALIHQAGKAQFIGWLASELTSSNKKATLDYLFLHWTNA
jgi:endonuclease/exonuclease/phosphatase family metal-dependent hydrolase